MKSGNENDKDGLAVSNEAVNKVAEAVIAAHANLPASSTERQDLEGAAEVLVGAMNVLEKNNSLQDITVKEIEELEKKVENFKSRSSIGTKIKAWFNSFIKFLKSPFTKQHKEELQQATENTVKEVEVIQKQAVQEQIATTIPTKEVPAQQSLVETPKSQATIPTTAPLAVPEVTRSMQAVVSSAPTMPPAQVTTITPAVIQPPVQVTVPNAPGTPPPPPPPPPPPAVAPLNPLAALKGMEKKSAEEIAKLAEPAGDLMSEMKKILAARKSKDGEIQIDEKSPKHLQELAEIRKLSEKDRLGEKEAVYGRKIEVTTTKPAVAVSTPPKVEFKDGVPVPPPPPPPMTVTAGVQLPKPAVKPPVAEPKVQTTPVQPVVDIAAIMEAGKNLKKSTVVPASKEPIEKPAPNFGVRLKPSNKDKGGASR